MVGMWRLCDGGYREVELGVDSVVGMAACGHLRVVATNFW
jgi:hypothetical protein